MRVHLTAEAALVSGNHVIGGTQRLGQLSLGRVPHDGRLGLLDRKATGSGFVEFPTALADDQVARALAFDDQDLHAAESADRAPAAQS